MTLHIFNPEHDIALASGLSNFTAPHAGRQLRHDLGFLPAIWAKQGDKVIVDDVEQARRSWNKTTHQLNQRLKSSCFLPEINLFFTANQQGFEKQEMTIAPWGWNSALKASLIRQGYEEAQLPTSEQLKTIRTLSHRRTAVNLLPLLRTSGTIGESFECQSPEQVEALLAQYGQLVMKAPWSSSGRGLRFLAIDRTPFKMQAGWFRNVVNAQECVIIEPFYHKIKDFGMEFYSDGNGNVSYLGLSLFDTANGAYTGNILATENIKNQMLARYIPQQLLNDTKSKICNILGEWFKNKYCGPFGVDMMIVTSTTSNTQECLLHPCVEINLRRTMGHVAIALSPSDDDIQCVMRIEYSENHYKLKINKL